MAEKTTSIKTYGQKPYYDNFDETKNYQRILYRPGHPVQARELTQMQTALQAQLDRLGQYNFKNGSRVLDGKVTLNVNYDYIKIKATHNSQAVANFIDNLKGTTLTGAGATVKAKIVEVVPASTTGGFDTLYVTYQQNGSDTTTSKFVADEVLTSDGAGTHPVAVAASSDSPIGLGSAVRIEQGVYFISGNFVYVPAESLFLDYYTNTPDYIVGLKVTESIATSADDTTLNDNAQGTTNEAAPGANRYKITTGLIKQPLALSSRTENQYIALMEVEGGKAKVDRTDKTLDTELSNRLARRTKEESGDYTVDVLQLNVREHLDNESGNNGYLTSGNGGDANKIALGVEPGVAYVSGYRVENANTNYVEANKPRGANALAHENAEQISIFVGNYVKVNEALMQGIPDTAGYTTVSLFSENITTGQSTVIGSARVRGIEDDAASGVKRLFLFDIEMTGSNNFSSVLSVKDSASGNTDGTDFRADINGTAQLFNTGNNGLVFRTPYNAVKSTMAINDAGVIQSTSDMIYTVKKRFTTNTNSSGVATFSAGSDSFANIPTSGFIYADIGGTPVTKQIGANSSWYTNSGSSIAINFATAYGASATTFTNVQFVCDVQKSNIDPKRKNKQTDGSVSASALGTVDGVANSLSLGKADILKVKTIVDANGTDVKDRFIIDNGQRDNFYDLGKIILKEGQTNPGNVAVTFDYYTHTGTGDYFSVDSYITDRTNASQTATQYEEIPSFRSGLLGKVELRDALDFRPRINDAGTGFTGSGGYAPEPISNGTIVTTDIQYHLPRIDKLVFTKAGKFKIIEGIPSEIPVEPETPEDSLELYKIGFSPYVFDINKHIHPFYKDNRRYTMNDIGSLDKRIKNLEYYTSLSLLEQSAADVQLLDDDGDVRLKNGFIVDSFKNHKIGDTNNVDYKASIDKRNSVLRPKFDERNVNLIPDGTQPSSACVKNGSIVTLPFTEVEEINQPYASFVSNVNPYNVFMWGGQIELSPESDEWKETDVRPAIIIDDSEAYDQFVQMAEEQGILGTVWNEWETNWTGVDVEENSFRNEGGDPRGNFWNRFGGQSETTQQVITTTSHQSRTGINTEVAFDTVQRSNGSKVVEVNFVPFIRSREIQFKAQLMKPNTKVYAFFDGVAVADYVREESSFTEFSDKSNVLTHEGETVHPDGAGLLTTDASGEVIGSFIIPRNDVLKFATGVREFRLSDSSSNNRTQETTFAEVQYHAQGLLESVQETIISTKVPKLVQTELNEDRVITETEVIETTEWVDPIAETFLVTKEGGMFANSVDIFFSTKDAAIPVRLTIRTTKNGVPTQRIVPGADVILKPTTAQSGNAGEDGHIATSTNGAAKTNFKFPFPIYLAQDVEYAIVLTANTDAYNCFVAEMGGFDTVNTAQQILKQPYGGVFFSSANASTWTPEQSKDMKFNLHRCEFSNSGAQYTLVNDTLPPRKLGRQPLTTTNSSAVVKVFHPNHGMHHSTSQVTISGAVATNGITAANLNGNHTITNITHDSYSFTAGGSATSSGAGGGNNVKATENRHIDTFYPNISNITVPGTSLTFTADMTRGKSINGNETPYTATGAFDILPNKNYRLASPLMIGSARQESQNITHNHSANITATMSFDTGKSHLSPVIDLNRTSIFTIQNIVGDSGSGAEAGEAVARGGSELARYITKPVELAEEADVATVYIDVNRPTASNVLLYFRAIPTGTGKDINDVAFELATPAAGSVPFNSLGFEEVRYDINPTDAFGKIQFKIVMQSTNSATPPRIKDFRAICAT